MSESERAWWEMNPSATRMSKIHIRSLDPDWSLCGRHIPISAWDPGQSYPINSFCLVCKESEFRNG